MMAYGKFANIYDELMQDIPYDQWVAFVKDIKEQNGINGAFSILDVACGTGELSIRFAKEGWDVKGVDLSESMLAVAYEKSVDNKVSIPFYEQNMTELSGFEPQDCVAIFCDSLNYLHTEEEIIQTFRAVHESLKDGGLFLFDVHSIFKMSRVFMNATFTLMEEHVSYIWNCYPGEHPNSVEHDLSFFVQTTDESNLYERFDETHHQRTFSKEIYEKWLTDAGFLIEAIYGDEPFNPYFEECERIFFVAKKKG